MNCNQRYDNKPFVSVVICTWNRKKYLENYSLPSALNQTYSNYEVIIVVDNSNDGTEEFLCAQKEANPHLKIVKNNFSRGIAYARNIGAYHAKGEIVAYTDDDCVLDENWLDELVKAHFEDPSLMAIGGFTYNGYSNNGIFGCNMSFRKEVFRRFSFDNNLYFRRTPMHEETDLVNRVKYHGFNTGFIKNAIVNHLFAPASYRKIDKTIGNHMNWIYMEAKRMSIALYYYKLLKRSQQMYRIIRRVQRKGALSFFDAWREIIWANCVLTVKLPLKAKLMNRKEERAFKEGVDWDDILI